MISKTQINKRKLKKRNPEIVETIELAKKNNLLELVKKLSSPRRNYSNINLSALNEVGENIIVIGKVLGQGEIKGRRTISALGFSKQAEDKLKRAGCEIKTIKCFIKDRANLEGVEIL